jgi:hypothetical protein
LSEPTFETPLSAEELATGDGFEPAMDDIDSTPRKRRGETDEAFAKRVGTMTVLGMDDELTEVSVPGSAQPGFRPYRRSQIAELRPYETGEVLDERISISIPDREAGSPKPGDMIARNPKNHADQWLVAAKCFADNFEPA